MSILEALPDFDETDGRVSSESSHLTLLRRQKQSICFEPAKSRKLRADPMKAP
jgi:hypothetical protein